MLIESVNKISLAESMAPSVPDLQDDPALAQAAREFEAAFLTHMLKFSGLGDALTLGGGKDVEAFADFYIQAFADEIASSGKLGLAERFYEKLSESPLLNGDSQNESL